MIDLKEKLRETEQAIEYLKQNGQVVPEEALEIREIIVRAKMAERGVEVYRQGFAVNMVNGLELGQKAYEAYGRQSFGKSLVSGQLLPPWADLTEAIQKAWYAAALDVVQQVLRNLE